MLLSKRIHIARRFTRAIRIDTDLGDPGAIEGFVCPQSSAEILKTMARHVAETGQGAFTWTGPYGSGKSSLIVALGGLLVGNAKLRRKAAKVFGSDLTRAIRGALPTGTNGWQVLPVVGRRDHPVDVIGDAITVSKLVPRKPRGGWTESKLISTITEAAARNPESSGGLILFIDEMGKFLEAAAQDNTDIYVFQQLAEAASRSNGRFIIIGVLHQAFEEYAHKLSHEMRDEWAKIQGRFIDLAVNTAGEEQIDLISRAIESDHSPEAPGKVARKVAKFAQRGRDKDSEHLARMLESSWPLHPVVACLLGPISRRRFGQNQRSIFGFLNSSELHGFRDFIGATADSNLYLPDRLWDYLQINLEPSILASPDGHRWALAAEALERCAAISRDAFHIRLLKTIAVIDLFKERSGLVAGTELLRACFPEITKAALKHAIEDLEKWSFIVFRKFLDSYSIFAGSDFDVDRAVRAALEDEDEIDFEALRTLAGLHPVLAKRHYHDTGALRWFDMSLTPLANVIAASTEYSPSQGTIGQFLLAIPTAGQSEEEAAELCRLAARQSDRWDTVVGVSKRSQLIITLARELFALERVRNDHPELAGDSVARREVDAQLAAVQAQLESELHRAIDGATWYRKGRKPTVFRQADLNSMASDLADRRFDQCPRLHNELLNRQKPSVSAVAAQNILLRRMVLNEGTARLGIDGYPAEGGLLASMLEATGLYSDSGGDWCFVPPLADDSDTYRLAPMWRAATEYIKVHAERTVSIAEIYDLWRKQPYGVKDGLMPVFAVAFILSQRTSVVVYRDGIFRARFDDVDVEYLAKDPSIIQIRWMDLSDVARRLLSEMAEIVRAHDPENELSHLEPIDVARGLVAIYDGLPQWTKRTMRLSANAITVRDLFKRARDPNKFLFDDIPTVVGGDIATATDGELLQIVTRVHEGIDELVDAYPFMLQRLRDMMLLELQVPNASVQAIAELRSRAENIRQLAGDFRLEAFVGRLSQFEGTDNGFEGVASLAVNKPPRDWVDPDLDGAAIEIADLSQRFLRAETFARVKGRPDKRQAMAVVIGLDGRPTPMLGEFAIGDADREAVNDLVDHLTEALKGADTDQQNIILAALAELSVRYMQDLDKEKKMVARRGQ